MEEEIIIPADEKITITASAYRKLVEEVVLAKQEAEGLKTQRYNLITENEALMGKNTKLIAQVERLRKWLEKAKKKTKGGGEV